MNKKIIFKALAIAAILAGIVLLVFSVQGIQESNKNYDLFRKIRVGTKEVYRQIDSEGLDAVKDEYRGAFALLDQMDALGGAKTKAYVDDVSTAYGLADTIEVTESMVASVNGIGADQARTQLDRIYAAIDEAEKALKAVNAAGAENAGTYLVDIEGALDGQEDADEARAELDGSYADLDEDTAKKVSAFFDYVFKMVKEKGAEEALAYLKAVSETPESTGVEFAAQLLAAEAGAEGTEGGEQLHRFNEDVFRLISDQGADPAREYIQGLLDNMAGKDIPDARAYLEEEYKDNEETRKYLEGVFRTIDAQGMEYALLHGGDICAVAGRESVDQAGAFLDALDGAAAGGSQGTALERLEQFRSAMAAAGKAADGSKNRYLTGLFAVSDEVEKAFSDEERARKKADKTAQGLTEAEEALNAAKTALAAAAEADKAAAQEALDAAQAAYDTAAAKAKKDLDSFEKKQVNEEKAASYLTRLEAAAAAARADTAPESLARVQEFQNGLCGLMNKAGPEKAKKYIENACKAYSDKTLRISELGTGNAAQLDAMNSTGVSRARGKTELLLLAVVLLIAGIALLFVRPSETPDYKLSHEARAQAGRHMGLKTSRMIANSAIHAVLVLISVIWLIPFISIVLQSLRMESTHQVGYIMPEKIGLGNYLELFNTDFPRWYSNTFIMALVVAVLQTVIVLCMSYTLSRFRFKMRKPLMRFMLILGMFPGMLSMIILYRVLSDLGLTQEHAVPGLILVYIASSGMGYYVSKGFFDTIPKSLDEAARVDGATRFQILMKIILPLSKPIVIYTVLTAFMGPWGDYVFARYISFGTSAGMNAAVGLNSWLSKDQIASRYTMFCAGGVLVAIPVAVLFMCLQRYYVEGVTGGAVKG